MPELPEVQTICNVIGPQVIGRSIKSVIVRCDSVLANMDTKAFADKVQGKSFLSMDRRGKYMILSLNSREKLVIHLRMTGGLLVAPKDYRLEKHTHVIFELDNGVQLRFSDMRRFGRIWYADDKTSIEGLSELGPEPFDKRITADYLKKKIGFSRRKIKECLLDQRIIAGIGNIYSDEILFKAGIYPGKQAMQLTDTEYERLALVIPEVMLYFVEKNQIDSKSYLESGGRDYRNTPYLRVYGRGGKSCIKCGECLIKTRIGERSSVYCPRCQRIDI